MEQIIFPCWEDSEYIHREYIEKSEFIDFMQEDLLNYDYLWSNPIW